MFIGESSEKNTSTQHREHWKKMNKLEKIRKQSVTKQKRPKKRSLTLIGEGQVERGTSGIDQMSRGKHSDQDIADNDNADSSGTVIP